MLKMIKIKNGWKRDKSQERGDVLFWYEKGEITASVVKGDIPNEAEFRISSDTINSISSRGDLNIIKNATDSKRIDNISLAQ